MRERAWRWRELVTRIASGGESSADISSAWWAGAEDLEGPNFPCPIGFQAGFPCPSSFLKCLLPTFLGNPLFLGWHYALKSKTLARHCGEIASIASESY